MSLRSALAPVPTRDQFELKDLESLTCGCVAAVYRSEPWDVQLVTIEAKGPHCVWPGHLANRLIRLDEAEID